MRIVIDGYYINKPRGMGRYLQELLYSLGRFANPEFQFQVLVPYGISQEGYILPDRIEYIRLNNAPFPVWEQWRLPKEIKRLGPDVAHFPYNTKPFAFHNKGTAHVVTIHDLIYMNGVLGRGGSWYQKLGNIYRKTLVSRFTHGMQQIVTDSEQSAKEIQEQLGLPSEVVYIPTEYGYGEKVEKARQLSSPLKGRYFLHVGGLSPHKNTERCIQAFLSGSLDGAVLVVVGMPINADMAIRFAGKRVFFPGWLTDEEMVRYYVHAYALLFPSLVEGYGLPIVEAFSVGVPVITSDLAPMSELAGDAALLIDPYSEMSITKAIEKISHDNALRARLIERGQMRLVYINGRNMAQAMMDVYRKGAETVSPK